MSDLFDDPGPVQGVSRRTRTVIWVVIIAIAALFALTGFAGLWTDHLWFDALGYGSVFTKIVWVKIGLFLGFGLVMAVALAAAMWAAFRTRPFLHPAMLQSGTERYREAINPIRTYLWLGISLVGGAFAGASAAGNWRTFELWLHGGSFGQKDPYFHKDLGFYVFDLPWLHMVVSFVMAAAVIAVVANLLVHYLYGGIRLQSPGDRLSGPAQVQISVLLAIFVLAKAADYWLDRYDLTTSDSPLFTGIGFTDDHAVLPAKSTLTGIALICAVLFLVNVWRRTWLLPGVGVALMAVSAILLGLIWPAIVQGVQVNPSKQDKENSYQATNIAQTRQAFAIDDQHVTVSNYDQDAKAQETTATALDNQTRSAPLVDPKLVHDLFQEQQQGRSYYGVASNLDVDRYDIAGKDRALVLGVRELTQSGLSTKDQNWTNLHTVYTHGSGVIAAYANQRNKADTAESSDIQFAEGIEPAQNDLVTAGPGEFEQRVYFGEDSPTYSIVGREKGAAPVEVDLGTASKSGTTVTDPSKGAKTAEDTTSTYDGKGGVKIGSTWRQLLYAIKFNSANILLSSRVNANSQVLYDRTPKERVAKVAPWLTLDDDAYPVVADGRITWVLDGYTTTSRYPGAEKESYKTMTADSQKTDTGLRTVPTDEINYMRNAVKATVDAYDGTVTLYAWDESDPILKAWSKVFPGTVKAKSQIPTWLTPHLRYPEDLFKVQRYQLAKYHVTSASDFLNGSDWWEVPTDPNLGATSTALQPAYRMFLDQKDATTGTQAQTWSLSTTFTPYRRNNLSAVMTVNSDATSAGYGKIQVLERPDQQTQGPSQVASDMKNNAAIRQALLPYTSSQGLLNYGSLLTIPTSSHGLVYLMPVYARQATTSPYPVLAYVLASYDNKVGYGRTLAEALSSALVSKDTGSGTGSGTGSSTPSASPSASPSGGASPSTTPSTPAGNATAKQLLDQAQTLFTDADAAGRLGDYAKREALLKQAEEKVQAALSKLQ
ncbi:UPF0182 family protein [Nocardioides sp.]|uniref:UPF0182 family membrane protein n=1 Tax=Nocardioides sp. TaxID=35761 RepID=UPI00261B02F8|nr:UPF0182 family protein [Nocardioides sp.]